LVDRGSMAYLLSTRVSRVHIVITHLTVLISGLFIVHLFTNLAGFIVFNLSIDTSITIFFLVFFLFSIVGYVLFVAIGSYSLLISALFNDELNAFSLALGISFIFYALNMV